MKFSIPAGELRSATEICRLAADKRSTIPILSYILVNARENQLSMQASNLEQAIERSVKIHCDAPGFAVLPANQLAAISAALDPEEVVHFSREGDKILLNAASFDTSMGSLDEDDFPRPSKIKSEHSFHMPEVALRHMLNTVRHAISNEETRYYLNGAYLEARRFGDQSVLRVAATDGHRLAYSQIACPEKALSVKNAIIPRAAVKFLLACLGGESVTVKLQTSDSPRAEFHMSNGIKVFTKLIVGTFPEYERIVPTDNPLHVTLDRDLFLAALTRVAAISVEERYRAVKLAFSTGKLCISCAYQDTCSLAQETIPCDWFSDPVQTAFQIRYLTVLLERFAENSKVTMSMSADRSGPVIFADAADDSAQFVLMPMRT